MTYRTRYKLSYKISRKIYLSTIEGGGRGNGGQCGDSNSYLTR